MTNQEKDPSWLKQMSFKTKMYMYNVCTHTRTHTHSVNQSLSVYNLSTALFLCQTHSSKSYLRVMLAGVVAFALPSLIDVVMPFLEPRVDDVRVRRHAMRRLMDVPAGVLDVHF